MSGYFFEWPLQGIRMECDHLRRERHELVGELLVRCSLPEARTVNGVLTVADFNFSSMRARQERSKVLLDRAGTNGKVDWFALLEEFCQKVFQSERSGEPAVNIWELPDDPPEPDDFAIDGLAFPRRLPSILFGDGGAAKSYLCLYLAGRLAMQGVNTAYFDWELAGEDHRKRFRLMFGSHQPRPNMIYCRCDLPLSHEIDRIYRVIRDHKIQYGFFDSLSFAADGRAEEHETCLKYFRACRQLNIGGIHVAHVNKSEEADKKPFGSAFWHNGARATWFCRAEPARQGLLELGVHHRKANCGPLRPSVAFKIHFTDESTRFERVSVMDTPSVATDVKVWQRVQALIEREGSQTFADIATRLDINNDTVRKAVERKIAVFKMIHGGVGEQDRVSLIEGCE